MRRFRFFPSFILSFFRGSPLEKGEEFKTEQSIFRMHWYSRNVLFEIRVMLFMSFFHGQLGSLGKCDYGTLMYCTAYFYINCTSFILACNVVYG